MKRKILLIDDDGDLSMITRDLLENYGYDCVLAKDCETAFSCLRDDSFHLIVLDINLPDGTGFEICQELRKVSDVPIIFASARGSEGDKIQGLDMGGDDYLAKPYSLRELLSRINALMRRSYGAQDGGQIYQLANITIETALRKVTRKGKELKLSLKEFDLLAYLCTHSNTIIRKEELLQEVWGVFSESEISTVAVHIRWLREKLEEDPAHPVLIKTVWGVGYLLDMEKK